MVFDHKLAPTRDRAQKVIIQLPSLFIAKGDTNTLIGIKPQRTDASYEFEGFCKRNTMIEKMLNDQSKIISISKQKIIDTYKSG